jgi:DNA-binding response OmpR family regulator
MALLLLVDDSPEIGLIVQRLGRRAGHEVVCRADAASAREFLAGSRPDLVLLDVNLPGESGLEMCRSLQREGAAPPVALFSHWDRPAEVAAGLDAGADFVLSKDLLCDPRAWDERLREILTPADSRPGRLSLSWTPVPLGTTGARACVAALNHALRHPTVRRLGPEVIQALVRRALRKAGTAVRGLTLLSDGQGLDAGSVAGTERAEAVPLFAAALGEEVWSLLGSVASAPFRAAVADAVPALSESLAGP